MGDRKGFCVECDDPVIDTAVRIGLAAANLAVFYVAWRIAHWLNGADLARAASIRALYPALLVGTGFWVAVGFDPMWGVLTWWSRLMVVLWLAGFIFQLRMIVLAVKAERAARESLIRG